MKQFPTTANAIGEGHPHRLFEDFIHLQEEDVLRINSQEAMYLRKGDVVLVRSANVPELGDHFIVVAGPPVMKKHGMRVQQVSITTKVDGLLNQYTAKTGMIILKLKALASKSFLNYYGILVENNEVIFPNSVKLEEVYHG